MDWITHAVSIVGLALVGWLVKKVKTPTDLERAQQLAIIAKAAAALVVSLNPRGTWSELLADIVNRLLVSSGIPTASRSAVERAAAAALHEVAPTKLGT